MRLRRPLFGVLALAVFGVSVGAGAAVGYARADAPGTGIRPAGVTGLSTGPGTTGAAGGSSRAGAPGQPEVEGSVPTPSPGDPPQAPVRAPRASWPLVVATARGPAPWFSVRVPVLMYHRVAPADQVGTSMPNLVVSPELFAAQLEALVAAGWHTITAAALAADLAAGRTPAPRTFVITFDDGRRDGYTEAFPILRRLRLVATFYVITGRIDTASSLTASQLLTMAGSGMEIGSHTADHVRLPSAGPDRAHLELADSAARIAVVTGRRPTTLAYPFGSIYPLDPGIVTQAGYALAFTEAPGCLQSWAARLFAPRIRVTAGTSPEGLVHQLEGCAPGG